MFSMLSLSSYFDIRSRSSDILILPICSCIYFYLWFYFTWLHHFYTEGVFTWDIITFVSSCIAIGPKLLTYNYIASPSEVDQNIHHSVHFLPLIMQFALNFSLKQEMQQICSVNLISLVNNSTPKAWHIQQGLILLGLP